MQRILRRAASSCLRASEPSICCSVRIPRTWTRSFGEARDENNADDHAPTGQSSSVRKVYATTGRLPKDLLNIYSDERGVSFIMGGIGRTLYFEHLALRDMCQCEACVDSSTQQRHFTFARIPVNIKANCVAVDGEIVEATWTNDIEGYGPEHKSIFTRQMLINESSSLQRSRQRGNYFHAVRWTSQLIRKARAANLDFEFGAYMNDEWEQARAVRALVRWGLIFIKGVPEEVESVKRIMMRLVPIRNTFYGETWDVRSVPGATNVAYTSRDLGFHQDLLYMANPPGLQALHVLKASASGGESLFSDGARAVDELSAMVPRHMQSLFRHGVTFRYKNAGEWYEYTRPTLEGGLGPNMRGAYPSGYDAINWSPPFQAPFAWNRGYEQPPARPDSSSSSSSSTKGEGDGLTSRSADHLDAFHDAAGALMRQIEHAKAVYETRMAEGECVLFNNRRILHARRAFPVGVDTGERWLRGTYGDLDPLMSRYRVLEESRRALAFEGRGMSSRE